MKTALITGADRGLGFSLTTALAKAGWRVFAGRFLDEYSLLDELKKEFPEVYPVKLDVSKRGDILAAKETVSEVSDKLDMIISNAAYMGGANTSTLQGEQPIDYKLLEYSIRVNSFGALQLMEIFLPLLKNGEMKRICFISSEVSSVSLMHRDGGFRYTMTKTAVNLAARLMYNELFDEGYTFRLYQPGWMKRVMPDGSRAEGAEIDPDYSAEQALKQFIPDRIDEMRLVLTDYKGQEWGF